MKELNIKTREIISTGFLKVERLKIELPNKEIICREVLLKKMSLQLWWQTAKVRFILLHNQEQELTI